ncbi:sensor domain-containing diguanylate cyclase [Mesorhizobium amorphae]|uniref:GGDEF domain-containing protein n=1 Tax=Mesorhizobium amorphae TaxID=71433 RepID=UPI0011850FDC|nr:GGDEF domain-containing protein [Mesorhizobium amorphae]
MKFIPSALLLLFAASFFSVWLLDRRRRHLVLFSLAFLSVSAGTVVQFALWPSDIGLNTLACAVLYTAGPLFLAEGVLVRSGKRMLVVEHAAWMTLMVGLLGYFYYAEDNLQLRACLLNLGMAGIVLSSAWKLRHLMRGSAIDRALLWMLSGLSLTFVLRTLLTGGSVPINDVSAFFESPFWLWAQFAMSVLGVAMGLGLLVVVCADVVLGLKAERDSDLLTSLLNRRGLETRAVQLFSGAIHQAVSVVACDIDRFKSINDRFGHAAGDSVLATVAETIRRCVRGRDLVARIGGEEFVILLRNCTVDDAYVLTEQLRREIAACDLAGLPEGFRVTCSFGIVECQSGEQLWDAIGRADKMLYAAKHAGRNRTVADRRELPAAA